MECLTRVAATPEKKWGEAHGHDYSIPGGPDFGVAEHLAELGALPHVFFKVTAAWAAGG